MINWINLSRVLPLLATLHTALAKPAPYLEGVGYREQELQTAKNSAFSSEEAEGVRAISMGGGTSIFIKGVGLHENPQSNLVVLKAHTYNDAMIPAPPLTEDDAFGSHPQLGVLNYHLPSLEKLFDMPFAVFNEHGVIKFTLYLQVDGHLFTCKTPTNCEVHYKRSYTPVVTHFSPPVVFAGAQPDIWFDPKNVMSLMGSIASDDLPFVNLKLDQSLINFEGTVSSDKRIYAWAPNIMRGLVGEQDNGNKPVNFLWETGLAHVMKESAQVCTFDESDCYFAKIVPVINSISKSSGFTTGGQELTISGYGFKGAVSVLVDGKECLIQHFQPDEVRCVVAQKNTPSVTGVFQGGHGLIREVFPQYQFNGVDFTSTPSSRSVATHAEVPSYKFYNTGQSLKGWFIPPETGRYKFYQACDDYCRLFLGVTPGQTEDVKKLIQMDTWVDYRGYYTLMDSTFKSASISEWVTLTKGEPYFLKATHRERGGADFMTVAVEIERNISMAATPHHHSKKEGQYFTIRPNLTFEKMNIIIEDVDDKTTVSMKVVHPSDDEKSLTAKITVGLSEVEMKNTLKAYWKDNYHADIAVTRKVVNHYAEEDKNDDQQQAPAPSEDGQQQNSAPSSDSDGEQQQQEEAPSSSSSEPTPSSEPVAEEKVPIRVDHVYEIEVLKLRGDTPSVSDVLTFVSGKSKVKVELPGAVQVSNIPFQHKYRFTCVDKAGATSKSLDIAWNANAGTIANQIQVGCPWTLGAIQVKKYLRNGWDGHGVDIFLRFRGYNADPGQFTLELHEDSPLHDTGLVITSETIEPFSTNLFYEPIPYEFLRTYETKPQVEVTVDGQKAVCKNADCDYTYIAPTSEVTSFTFDSVTKVVTFAGTGLPQDVAGFSKVEFAETSCILDEATIGTDSLKCTLSTDPTCGDHLPKVFSNEGLVPVADGVAAETIACSIDRMSAFVDEFNKLGDQLLTLHGNNLPKALSGNSISISFSDSQSTACVPESTSTEAIVCRTSAFSKNDDYSTPVALKATINGQALTPSITVKVASAVYSATTMTPSSVSPTLKTKVHVELSSSYSAALSKDDFSIKAVSTTDKKNVRYLRVVEVESASKTLVCMFGGAVSGSYQIVIEHVKNGLFDTTGLLLDVSSKVTAVSIQSISRNGGAFFTITGTNFGKEFTDNPVQISYNGGIKSTDCILSKISSTEIQCRMDVLKKPKEASVVADLVVFQKASEEATCEPKSACQITFDAAPLITSAETAYEGDKWLLKITGSGFGGATELAQLKVAGVEQTFKSMTSSELVFELSNLPVSKLNGQISLVLESGAPAGIEVLTDTLLEVSPKFIKATPNAGSVHGSEIILEAPGVSKDTLGQLRVYNSASKDLCSSTKIETYPFIICKTIAEEVVEGDISLSLASTAITCEGSHATNCLYKQLASDSFPEITAVSKASPTEVTITGTNLDFDSTFTPKATFLDLEATSITVGSSTEMTLTFEKGVPFGTGIPSIKFVKDGVTHFTQHSVELANPLSVTSSSQSLECSFAGGCQYEIVAPGLATSLQKVSNHIKICDTPCSVEVSQADKVVCSVPRVATIFSNDHFSIERDSHDLDSGIYFGTASSPAALFDNDITVENQDSSSTCIAGMSFRKDHVAILSQVKFFMGDIERRSIYNGNLKFEGSADGITYTTLFTVDANIHEGWNYHNWEENDLPKFRFYRFKGKQGSCNMHEVAFRGIQAIDDSSSTYSCEVALDVEGASQVLNPVTYASAKTAVLESVSPRFGSVTGGDSITFTGKGFSTDISKIKVTIDGVDCPVSTASATSLTCTTGKRPGLVEPSLKIEIDGFGLVSANEVTFTYVNKWTDDHTWGGEFAPMEMESIHIPKGLNLLVDVDSTPKLNAIIVEGQLIFAPDADPAHERWFDAHYIFINGGKMEVGTEAFPYTSKLTITMHSKLSDPYIPVYGNKVIGLRYGTLDMHGIQRQPTWTSLETTAAKGSSQITLQEKVDWQVGEEIAIASTSYSGRDAEQRTIMSIDRTDPNKPVLTLNATLVHKHYAATEKYGSDSIELRAEVGLLTRNVKYQGDNQTSALDQYGATMFLHSEGDDSLKARLSYIELFNSGQAFKVGRYSIHFHMIGTVHSSYVRGISVHQSHNRAVTLHAVKYLTVEDIVGYDIMGHAIFMEDGVERKNMIRRNLIMNVKRSWSLLVTDQTPACYWITNPDNNFIDNHAAGSDRYGFWYDLQTHAIGPSANTNICPENERVGEHRGSFAHSVGRYGVRIFHNMLSRKYPCKPIVYDYDKPEDPYWKNPILPAIFKDVTSWKNGRCGIIAEKVTDFRVLNFKGADNKQAGVELSFAEYKQDTPQVQGGLFVGKSQNDDPERDAASPNGIVTPGTENFAITGAKFHSYDFSKAAAIGTCSHCGDAGGRQVNTSSLFFNSTNVPRRVTWTTNNWIFYDLDGTLTEAGPRTWATAYNKHMEVPECTKKDQLNNGLACDSSVQLRRLLFNGQAPGSLKGVPMRFMRYDENKIDKMDNATRVATLLDKNNYSTIPWTMLVGWGVPFVTGYKYSFFFDNEVDISRIKMEISENWQPNDKEILLFNRFYTNWESIDLNYNGASIANDSLSAAETKTGQSAYTLEQYNREITFRVNGKGKKNNAHAQSLVFTGIKCTKNCLGDEDDEDSNPVDEKPLGAPRSWKDPTSWESGAVPKEGDEIIIKSGWNMIYDLEGESPVFKKIEINGNLKFSDELDTNLRAQIVFVRAGKLEIGTKEAPHQHKAQITLVGEKTDDQLMISNDITVGNKALANLGTISLFGKSRQGTLTRLMHPVYKGDSEFRVQPGLDIEVGDRLLLVTTTFSSSKNDEVFVKSYNPKTGGITIAGKLKYYHWGAPRSTAEKYNGVDIRGEVVVLSRNIRIVGDNRRKKDNWGGSFITAAAMEADFSIRSGQLTMDNVEVFNIGQVNTENGILRVLKANKKPHQITNCALHNGDSLGVKISGVKDVLIKGNAVYNTLGYGIGLSSIKGQADIFNNIVVKVGTAVADDPTSGILGCTSGGACDNLSVQNNIVVGTSFAGYSGHGHECGQEASQTRFRNNVVHSMDGEWGATIGSKSRSCYAISHFAMYKLSGQGIGAVPNSDKIEVSRVTSIDNSGGFGAALATGSREYGGHTIEIRDSHFYGESAMEDCPPNGGFCIKKEKYAIFGSYSITNGKSIHEAGCNLPMFNQQSHAAWDGIVKLIRNKFIGFSSKTRYGQKQAIYRINPLMYDYTPMQEFIDSELHDVQTDAIAFMMDPNPSWAEIEICGNFPCTSPWNTFISFENTKFFGSKPANAQKSFQIIPDNPDFSPFVPGCKYSKDMNAYSCNNDYFGILQFESLDYDRLDRSSQPIYLNLQGTKMKNKLNAYKDHGWDGFYNKQERLTRFPAIVYAPKGSVYDITYTGSPAKKQNFELFGYHKRTGTTVRIAFPSAESKQIKKDGSLVAMNKWDQGIKQYGEVRQKFCGEHRYIGVKNILEFYITAGCRLTIEPRNAIQSMVRMEWSMDEFFAEGGTTKFADRLAGSLGIHASTIKVVSVYQGSLVVNYEILTETEEAKSKLEETQTKAFASGSVNLGAPILDVAAGDVKIISDGVVTAPGYKPVVITQTESNVNFDPSDVFNPVDVESSESTVVEKVVIEKEQVNIINDPNGGNKQIVYTEPENGSTAIILMGAALIFLASAGVAAFKYYSYQKEKALIDAKIIREKHQEYQATSVKVKAVEMLDFENDIRSYSKVQPHSPNALKGESAFSAECQQQYDPTVDFTIFGHASSLVEQHQLGKKKMNKADDLSSEGRGETSDNLGSSGTNFLKINRPSSPDSAGGESTGQLSSNPLQPPSPNLSSENAMPISEGNLPEDKEIASDSEDIA